MTFYDTLVHAKGGLPDNSFFRTADAAVLFFDTTKEESYEKMEAWYEVSLMELADEPVLLSCRADSRCLC